jgi:AcrR family transcriptional regulator
MANAQPYHHVNLRQTLLDAAVALIGEVGPRAFTLREVARRAGVSHNAPYRHFAGKNELLTSVAAEGFDRLTETMERKLSESSAAVERLILSGCGYVEFALRWPHHFLVMFDAPPDATLRARPGLPAGEFPHRNPGPISTGASGPAPIGESAFHVLLGCIAAAQESGDLRSGDPMPQAFITWSLVHGIAKLAIGGNLPMDAAATLEFTRAAAGQLLAGLHPAAQRTGI